MRRLFPPGDQRDVGVRDAYDVARPRPAERPWVGLCMVAGLDGSTVVAGNSRALSNPTDTEVLLTLRSLADVLIVGASTVRIEGYGPPSSGAKVGVVTRSGEVDTSTDLFRSGAGFLIMPEDGPAADVPAIRAGRGTVDFAAALAQLDARFVQTEGGAALNAAMFAADVIDELNLTVSPHVTGGSGPRLTSGAPDLAHRMTLSHVFESDGFLFTRYVRSDRVGSHS